MKPRIAIFSPLVRDGGKGGYGGVAPVVLNLAEEFSKRGIAVDLLIFPPKGSSPRLEPLPCGTDVINLQAQHKTTLIYALGAYFKRKRPTALLAINHRANIVAGVAKKLYRPQTKVYASLHNIASRDLSGSTLFKRLERKLSIRIIYSWTEGIVAVSDAVATDLSTRFGVKSNHIQVIPNPVVSSRLYKLSEQDTGHPWMDCPTSPVILAVGRLEPIKDFSSLLRAFAKVRQQRECRLILLGEGRERDKLRNLSRELNIQHEVSMPGFSTNPYAFMRRASVVVLSSRSEGAPLVLIEAMTLGIPVVATDCGGPREILRGGTVGPLTPIGDVDALQRSIMEVMDDPPAADILKEATNRYSATESAKSYLDRLLS